MTPGWRAGWPDAGTDAAATQRQWPTDQGHAPASSQGSPEAGVRFGREGFPMGQYSVGGGGEDIINR